MAGVEYIGTGRWATPISGVVVIVISSLAPMGSSCMGRLRLLSGGAACPSGAGRDSVYAKGECGLQAGRADPAAGERGRCPRARRDQELPSGTAAAAASTGTNGRGRRPPKEKRT